MSSIIIALRCILVLGTDVFDIPVQLRITAGEELVPALEGALSHLVSTVRFIAGYAKELDQIGILQRKEQARAQLSNASLQVGNFFLASR